MLLRITHNDWIMSESISDLQIAMYVNHSDKSMGISLRAVSHNGVPASFMQKVASRETLEINVGNRVFSAEDLNAALTKTANMYNWVGPLWDSFLREREEGSFHGTYAEYCNKLLIKHGNEPDSIFREYMLSGLGATITELNSILDDAGIKRN